MEKGIFFKKGRFVIEEYEYKGIRPSDLAFWLPNKRDYSDSHTLENGLTILFSRHYFDEKPDQIILRHQIIVIGEQTMDNDDGFVEYLNSYNSLSEVEANQLKMDALMQEKVALENEIKRLIEQKVKTGNQIKVMKQDFGKFIENLNQQFKLLK